MSTKGSQNAINADLTALDSAEAMAHKPLCEHHGEERA